MSKPFDHPILILRGIRAGVLSFDATAGHYVFDGKTFSLSLHTKDETCLTTDMARRICQAIQAVEDAAAA